MDFKAQVISGAEQKYQDMLSGKTEPAIRPDLQVEPGTKYSGKRQRFVQRLDKERKQFNDAIATVKKNREARLKGESDYRTCLAIDRSNFGGVTATTIIFVILMIAFAFCFVKFDLLNWVSNSLLPATGEHISAVIDFDNEGIVLIICAIISAIIGIVLFFAFVGDTGLIASGIIASIAIGISLIVLRLVAFLVGYLIYYMFQPWSALALAGVACVLNLVLGRDMMTSKYTTLKWVCCLICAVVGVAVMLIVKA